MTHITVNGQPETVPSGSSLLSILEAKGLTGRRLAVEINGEVVPRAQHPATLVVEGDVLEIVVAVGGG